MSVKHSKIMKKITLLFSFILIMCCSFMNGQNIGYGFKLGVNFSQINNFSFDISSSGEIIDFIDFVGEENRAGLTASFFANIPINERFSFQPELSYSPQGFNEPRGFKIEYLQLPLGLMVDLNKFFISAGPQVGLKISNSEQSDLYKSLDFSGFGGLGYYFTDNIFIEARYTIGFSDVFEENIASDLLLQDGTESTGFLDISGKNAYFTFNIGYRL